jgi:hypothetical protein
MGLGLALIGHAYWQWSQPAKRIAVTPTERIASTPTPRIAFTPIEQIRVGDRVLGENPLEPPDHQFGDEVTPATWRKMDLRCRKKDGSDAEVTLIRPVAWLEERGAKVGGVLRIAVPECGIDGDAEVLSLGPCPPIKPGKGNVVIGTFKHLCARILSLQLDNLDSPIKTTLNHRFWSNTRRGFCSAQYLWPLENIGINGKSSQVVSLEYTDTYIPVYNLEAYGSHVYLVTNACLLVHNTDPSPVEYTTVYRGVNAAEANIFRESGHIFSDAGKEAYRSARGEGMTVEQSVTRAYQASEIAHAQHLRTWGNIDDYKQAHGLWGQEIKQPLSPDYVKTERSLISFSTDKEVAGRFGTEILEIKVPKDALIKQAISTSNEHEFLIKNGVKPCP